MKWKTIKSTVILKNNFLEVTKNKCRKTDSTIVPEYYIVKRPDVVIIAAFTNKMELIMINQFRYPVNSWDMELPAGYTEPEDKNNLKKSAERELLEETGYKANLKKIGTGYASAGMMNNKVNFFIGFNAKKIQKPNLEQSEELKVRLTPWKTAIKLVQAGKTKDLGSISGILLAKEYLENHPSK